VFLKTPDFYLTGEIEDASYYPLKDGGTSLHNFIEKVYNNKKGFIRHEVIAHRMIFTAHSTE